MFEKCCSLNIGGILGCEANHDGVCHSQQAHSLGQKASFFSDVSFNVTLCFSLAEQMGDNGEWVQPRWAKWLFITG